MDFTGLTYGNEHNSTVESSTFGEKTMFQNGQPIATQKQGIFPETTSTYEDGHKVAATKSNVISGTDIIQDGQHTGIMKEDIHGNLSLYDTNYTKLATLDPDRNVKSVMNHADPLSQVDRINFQQLKFAGSHGEKF